MEDLQAYTRRIHEAIRDGKTEHQAKIAEAQRRQEEIDKVNRDKAKTLLEGVPGLILRAAADGKNFATVLEIMDKDISFPHYGAAVLPKRIYPEWLRGCAKIVYDSCKELGLKSTLEFREGTGNVIVVHWV